MPRIGIDYTPAFEQGGGIGRYVRELTAALMRNSQAADIDCALFVAGARQSQLPALGNPRFTWKPNRLTNKTWLRLWHRASLPLPIEALIGQVDLYHATDFVLPPTRARALLTVHDLSFVRVPEAASPNLRAFLNAVVPKSVARAHHILADSAATKNDLITFYRTPPEKITVLYSGVDDSFQRVTNAETLAHVRRKYHLPDRPFILSVGTVQPRKNYARLVEAVSLLRARAIDIDLVIVGGRGWLQDGIYQSVDQFGLAEHVHFAGFADDADLPAIYSAAHAMALPSLYEGFGLPILEAFACGTPVLTSNVSSLPEVAGEAALLVSPVEIDALVSALARLIEDSPLRQLLIERGLARAREFTWDGAARQLQSLYHHLT